jgi:hypothetical protein
VTSPTKLNGYAHRSRTAQYADDRNVIVEMTVCFNLALQRSWFGIVDSDLWVCNDDRWEVALPKLSL